MGNCKHCYHYLGREVQVPGNALEMDSFQAQSDGKLHVVQVFTKQIKVLAENATNLQLASNNIELIKRVKNL